MFDRRLISNFDWGYFSLIVILAIIGYTNLYSASFTFEGLAVPIYMKQMYWIGIGGFLMTVVFMIDYRKFEEYAYFFYVICVLLLILVLVTGTAAGGARRWINFGFFRVQVSEFMKISLILALAKFFHNDRARDSYTLRDLTIPIAMITIPVLLIIKEPDLGTALMLLFIAGSIIFFVKVNTKSLVIVIILGLLASPLGWYSLKEYQKQRILTLFSAESTDPLSTGYHSIQSKIAVGSGGFTGKGFMQGTQSQLRFLPEHHTDFIFSVLAEEWGLFGCFVVLVLFLLLLLGGIKIASSSKEKFGSIVAIGITAMLFWHIVINIGMVIGIMPVVGITLPLFSYGGSSIVTTFICFGFMLSISMRRFI
jgi:rod shape determining protein RodA